MSKTRLDVAMAAQGLAESRQKAQAIIMSGLVFVDGKRVDKCGAQIADTAVIEVRGKTLRYVSRGGLKLEKAMQCFPLTLQDAVAMDCGASTRRVHRLYAPKRGEKGVRRGRGLWAAGLEAAAGQNGMCAWSAPRPVLDPRTDPGTAGFRLGGRVLHLPGPHLPSPASAAGGQRQLGLSHQTPVRGGQGQGGQEGVVRDPKVHLAVLEQFLRHAAENDLTVKGMTYSPIKGPEGNIE